MTNRTDQVLKLLAEIDAMIPPHHAEWGHYVTCNRCGAAVRELSRFRHWRWHRSNVEQAARTIVMHETVMALWGDKKTWTRHEIIERLAEEDRLPNA